MTTIHKVLRVQTTVRQDGEIQINDPSLHSGDNVEIIVLLPATDGQRSVMEILNETPGHRLYKSADEVDAYIAAERATWDG